MSCFDHSWSRLVLVVTAAGFCAATATGTARADDGAEPASLPAAEIAAVPEVEESVTAIVVEAIEGSIEDLDATSVVPSGVTDDPEEETGSSGAAREGVELPVETDAAVAETPASTGNPAPENGSELDTASDSGDTAVGSTAPAATEAGGGSGAPPVGSTTPATATAAPRSADVNVSLANVNVSVRIGSAGDNGPVTQTNTRVGAPTSAAPRDAVSTPGGARDAEPQPASGSTTESTWYWEWDCLGSPVLGSISPDGSNGGSVPQNWTWIWNCPSNSERYEAAPETPSQQFNANVSIRISSPGDDGPVTQTNIAAALSVVLPEALLPSIPALPSLPAITIPMPAISLPAISIAMPQYGRDVPGIATSTTSPISIPPGLALAPVFSISSDTALVVEIGGGELAVKEAVEIAVGTDTPVESELLVPVGPPAPAPEPTDDGALPGQKPALGRAEPRRADAESTVASWTTGSPEPAVAARPAHETDTSPRTRPAPSWKPSAARRSPAAAPSGASASAAGAGGSSGGGLPIFLALPFLAAVLDLARRVALERATWPSGHRRRMPDTPG